MHVGQRSPLQVAATTALSSTLFLDVSVIKRHTCPLTQRTDEGQELLKVEQQTNGRALRENSRGANLDQPEDAASLSKQKNKQLGVTRQNPWRENYFIHYNTADSFLIQG